MLGDTITLTVNTVARVLKKINQDNYSSEYLLRNTTDEYRLNVRHSKENAALGVTPFERHNLEFRQTTFATTLVPELIKISSLTIRCKKGDDPVLIAKSALGLTGYATEAVIGQLIGWES